MQHYDCLLTDMSDSDSLPSMMHERERWQLILTRLRDRGIVRVTDLVGEISAASSEQSAGVSQVGEAVTQMDQVTQQNAAQVQRMADAASKLQTQALALVEAVAFFRLDEAARA